MIRCTIELIPHGREKAKRIIGLIEIANDGTGSLKVGNYAVVCKKSAPWNGALKHNWKGGTFRDDCGDEVLAGRIVGHHRLRRGVYDLLYRALQVCVGDRNPSGKEATNED